MKFSTFLLGGVAALALSSGAFAADLIVDVPATEPVAVADTGWYLSVFGGAVWADPVEADDDDSSLDFDTDLGWLLGAAVGANITDNLRGEIELSTGAFALTGVTDTEVPEPLTIDDGSATTTYLLANVWFDIDTGSGFTPYIGGGLGAGYVTAEGQASFEGTPVGDPVDLSGWGFAYQLGAGVKFDVADNVALDLGYRFKSIVDAELEGDNAAATATVSSHVLQVGVTFGF
jgi:opacity protein-like surface antigen